MFSLYRLIFLSPVEQDCIIKTLIAAQPTLKQNYRACFPTQSVRNSACFEVLGFDLMLDKKLKPWVIEVSWALPRLELAVKTP